MRLLQ